MITITMDWPTAVAVLASLTMVVGGIVEVFRSRWPREWWHDLDKRIAILEARMDAAHGRPPESHE